MTAVQRAATSHFKGLKMAPGARRQVYSSLGGTEAAPVARSPRSSASYHAAEFVVLQPRLGSEGAKYTTPRLARTPRSRSSYQHGHGDAPKDLRDRRNDVRGLQLIARLGPIAQPDRWRTGEEPGGSRRPLPLRGACSARCDLEGSAERQGSAPPRMSTTLHGYRPIQCMVAPTRRSHTNIGLTDRRVEASRLVLRAPRGSPSPCPFLRPTFPAHLFSSGSDLARLGGILSPLILFASPRAAKGDTCAWTSCRALQPRG